MTRNIIPNYKRNEAPKWAYLYIYIYMYKQKLSCSVILKHLGCECTSHIIIFFTVYLSLLYTLICGITV